MGRITTGKVGSSNGGGEQVVVSICQKHIQLLSGKHVRQLTLGNRPRVREVFCIGRFVREVPCPLDPGLGSKTRASSSTGQRSGASIVVTTSFVPSGSFVNCKSSSTLDAEVSLSESSHASISAPFPYDAHVKLLTSVTISPAFHVIRGK